MKSNRIRSIRAKIEFDKTEIYVVDRYLLGAVKNMSQPIVDTFYFFKKCFDSVLDQCIKYEY